MPGTGPWGSRAIPTRWTGAERALSTISTGYLAAEWDKVEPVDAAEYHAWLDPYLGEGEELALPYCPLTAENIRMVQTAG